MPVLLVFCHHRFLRHRQGYWFCWFLDHHRLLQHSSWILVCSGLCVIVACYSIDKDIGFVGFLDHHCFLKHSSGILVSTGFCVIIAFYSIDKDIGLVCLSHHRLLQHSLRILNSGVLKEFGFDDSSGQLDIIAMIIHQ